MRAHLVMTLSFMLSSAAACADKRTPETEALADDALQEMEQLGLLIVDAEVAQEARMSDLRTGGLSEAGRAEADRCRVILQEADQAEDRQTMRLLKLSAGNTDDLPDPVSEALLGDLRGCT